jgi:hypothetical protein
MTLQLDIDRLRINAPISWAGGGNIFRAMLQRALKEELQRSLATGEVGSHQLMRVDMAPVTVEDVHDMQEAAREIARRIVLTIRQNPE